MECSETTSPADEQQALAIFRHAAEELRFFKGQQWSVANYTLLAYAALALASERMGGIWKASSDVYVAVAVAIAVAMTIVLAWACAVLWSLEMALDKERKRLEEVRPKLPLVDEIHAKFPPAFRSVVAAALSFAVVAGWLLAVLFSVSALIERNLHAGA
jgi:hypothetical protein